MLCQCLFCHVVYGYQYCVAQNQEEGKFHRKEGVMVGQWEVIGQVMVDYWREFQQVEEWGRGVHQMLFLVERYVIL